MLATLHPGLPVGTSVGVYPASEAQRAQAAHSPGATAITSAVVASDGSVDFEGLEAGTAYFAAAQAGGVWRWTQFRTAPSEAALFEVEDPEDTPVVIDVPADQSADVFVVRRGGADLFSIDADGVISAQGAPALPINVASYPYLADRTGVADVTAAIQAAIDDLPANGGTLFFPRGSYNFAGELDVDETRSVSFVGEGGLSAGLGTGTVLSYSGTAASFISARSTFGFTMRDVMVAYTNAGFTGTLVDLSGAAAVTHYAAFERCQLAGAGVRTAAQLVLLNNAIDCSFEKVVLQNAAIGIRGRLTSGDFSNGHKFESCWFVLNTMTTACFAALGQGCTLDTCTLEALVSGAPGGYRQLVGGAAGLTISGCWMGDATVDGTWLQLDECAGATILGNYFGGFDDGGTPTCTAISVAGTAARGVVVVGNEFELLDTAVDWGALTAWCHQQGNNYHLTTNVYAGVPLSGSTEHASGNGGNELHGATVASGSLRHTGTQLGFYGAAAVAKPTGVTVDAAGIHAALVTLGLISA